MPDMNGSSGKRMVATCPVCGKAMTISRLSCSGCETVIECCLPIPNLFRLPEDLMQFVMVFLRCRGSIRDVEKELGISYPTVCKRLDLVNSLLGNTPPQQVSANEILEQLERGEISAKEAAQHLKGRV